MHSHVETSIFLKEETYIQMQRLMLTEVNGWQLLSLAAKCDKKNEAWQEQHTFKTKSPVQDSMEEEPAV